jgi:D-amino-acid oxidase
LLDLWQKGKAAEVGICMIPVYRLTTEPGGYPDPEYKNVVFGYTRLNEKQLNQLIKEHGRNYTY